MATDQDASQTDEWTIGRLLTWTTEFFAQHDISQPRLDAEVLLAHARSCERIELYAAFGDLADDGLRSEFRELVRRRATGTPVAYLVGYREFFSLRFDVSSEVLIPRPETEHLVVAAVDFLKDCPGTPEVADIGTGSGAIAVCVARSNDRCRVTAVDSSSAALAIAAENVRRHDVAERVTLFESDLLDAVEEPEQFALIASNPPYISTREYEALPTEIKDHEPRQALLAGATGIEVIERIVELATTRLEPGGRLLLEISPMVETASAALLEARPAIFECVRCLPDLAGHPRVIQADRCH